MSRAHRPCSIPGQGGGQKRECRAAQLRFCPQIQHHGPQVHLPQSSAGPAHAVHLGSNVAGSVIPIKLADRAGHTVQAGKRGAPLSASLDEGTTDLQLAGDRHMVMLTSQAVRRVALDVLAGAGTSQCTSHHSSCLPSLAACHANPYRMWQASPPPSSWALGQWALHKWSHE